MATIKVTTDNLFQGGRVNSPDSSVQPTFLRYAQALSGADVTDFQFPTGTSGQQTFGTPLTAFIDNAQNNFPLQVSVGATQQSFPVPANSTGYYLLDAIPGATIEAVSGGNSTGPVEFIFYNYARTPFVWYKFGTNVSAVTIADGADAALGSTTDAAVTNPASNATLIAIEKGLLTLLGGTLKTTSTPSAGNYEAVAANATAQVLGGAGAVGDRLNTVTIFPANTSPGHVIINDGATAIATFPGGAASVSNLVPFIIDVSALCIGANWNVTTGADVSVLANGKFT